MKKAFAALGLSLMLAVASSGHGSPSAYATNPLIVPPFPPAGIFAVLMPNKDQCRIVLLRDATHALLFPGTPTPISFVVYLMLDTKAYMKNGKAMPLTFSFRETAMYVLSSTSENVPVPCGELSHLEVFDVRCRLQAIEIEQYDLFRETYSICAPELPRRLNFFAVMEGDPGVPLVED